MDVSNLKQDSKKQAFINDICSRLDALEHSSDDLDEYWTVFRDTVYSSALDSLEPVSRKLQEWFKENDEEIQGLLEEKPRNTRHISVLPAQYLVRLSFQTYVRESRLSSDTCKAPGWAKRLMKFGPLQTKRVWRSFLMHLRQ